MTVRLVTEEASNGSFLSGQWKSGWNHMFMCGKSIKDSVIGIVGAGRIGNAIAERLIPFKAKQLLYCGRSAKPGVESLGARFVSFDELLEKSDFVIVCCLLSDTTRRMFNESAFKRMKRTAILINTSRGAVVDQTALYYALTNREIAAAGLDVMQEEPIPADDPLLSLSNVGRSLSLDRYRSPPLEQTIQLRTTKQRECSLPSSLLLLTVLHSSLSLSLFPLLSILPFI